MNFMLKAGAALSLIALCGTVLWIFSHLRRIRREAAEHEALLMPFRMDGQPIGTIWAALHQPGSQFDAEDRRLLKNLSDFAAAAYRALVKAGQLEAIIGNLPGPYGNRRPSNEDGKWCFGENSIDRYRVSNSPEDRHSRQ